MVDKIKQCFVQCVIAFFAWGVFSPLFAGEAEIDDPLETAMMTHKIAYICPKFVNGRTLAALTPIDIGFDDTTTIPDLRKILSDKVNIAENNLRIFIGYDASYGLVGIDGKILFYKALNNSVCDKNHYNVYCIEDTPYNKIVLDFYYDSQRLA